MIIKVLCWASLSIAITWP